MINRNFLASAVLVALATLFAPLSRAQAPLQDDFTGTATQNQWFFFNGACLTAGTSSVSGNLGQPAGTDASGDQLYSLPGCLSIASSFYNEVLVGGENGYLGSSSKPGTPAAGAPDDAGQGALRFTNGSPGGYAQNGAIVSASTFPTGQGVEVTFETVTYRGDSGGAGSDGADGLSFYLLDGCMPMAGATPDGSCYKPSSTTFNNPVYGVQGNAFPGIGAWGGSLAYTCSNANTPYDGLVGAYLGLGIDEFGNFLNGTTNTLGETGTSATGDNTASGGGYQPGRIGLRGAGSISWQALTTAYGTDPLDKAKPYYPSGLTAAQKLSAVQNTCSTGDLFNYKKVLLGTGSATNDGAASLSNAVNTAGILDYPALGTTSNPGYSVLTGLKIANEAAVKRSDGNPILYDLKITQDGLLSLSYQQCTATGCGAKQSVLTKQQITTSNGPLPANLRFGFAGSTGGDTNVHEVMCFKAQPATESSGSAGVNEKQSAKIESGTFAYFSYYDPDDWTGRVTANALGTDASGTLVVSSVPQWDASCTLSGIAAGQTCSTGVAGPVAAQGSSSRVILTWDGTKGVPFESSNLSAAETAALNAGDSQAASRISYLRGDRTNEINSSGVGLFRARDSVLADIVDSSPTWVGPPSSPYTAGWQDRLNISASQAENSGTQTYTQFIAAEQTRPNVVYVGANDGMLHGFRSGGFDSSGNFTTASTANDGEEVLAFMPGSTITGSVLSSSSDVDTIHGTDPTNSNAITANLDYPNSQYGHNFYVDATPGTGDLFYDGAWHTWLVSGLGAGGAALFALDVTNPSAANFTESNAQSLVIGEWTPSSLSCVSPANCGANLGKTYGTPVIRRLHNGSWGVIFGNGIGSQSGDAGIYIMVVSGSGTSVTTTFYYLSTGVAGGNGIAYATPADLDGDHVTDYVYAGDVKGNVWRFDLTSSDPANWGISRCLDYPTCSTVTTAPLFSTGGQPITSQLIVASGPSTSGPPQIIVAFGTGQKTLFTNTDPTTYISGTQDIYGFWDWNMAPWNALGSAQYASLVKSQLPATLASPYAITKSNLQTQTFTINSIGTRDIAANQTVCWQGTSACSSGANNQFGWYVALPGAAEQIVFNPELLGSAFLVNSTVPPDNEVLSCKTTTETGYTYALNVMSGGAFTNFFPNYHDTVDPNAAGVNTNATGTSFPVRTGNGNYYLVYQTYSPGTPGTTPLPPPLPINPPANAVGHRLTWIQLR
ncbi:MAG: PilC/PilY family type IV pilus protein [Steroidobacteraceae bacterium]